MTAVASPAGACYETSPVAMFCHAGLFAEPRAVHYMEPGARYVVWPNAASPTGRALWCVACFVAAYGAPPREPEERPGPVQMAMALE